MQSVLNRATLNRVSYYASAISESSQSYSLRTSNPARASLAASALHAQVPPQCPRRHSATSRIPTHHVQFHTVQEPCSSPLSFTIARKRSCPGAQAAPHDVPREEDTARQAHLGVVTFEEYRRAIGGKHHVPANHLEPRLLEHGRAVRLDHQLARLGDAWQRVANLVASLGRLHRREAWRIPFARGSELLAVGIQHIAGLCRVGSLAVAAVTPI
mmetsp:Transcript_85920/g.171573  ORF Transcript_85920/g.171573 Transcript_85920/m.171573 type:complete len:214 (+) Transcript_85920:89-730(+)